MRRVIYITLATALARSICSYVNGNNCGGLAYIIQTGLTLVYVAAAHTSGAVPETLPGARRRDEDIHAAYVEWWHNTLASPENGIEFDSIKALPFNKTEAALVRRDGDPALISRVFLSGVTGVHTDTKQDVIVNHFEDGNTLLHLPLGGEGNFTNGLGKRVPKGSGFKISYVSCFHRTVQAVFLLADAKCALQRLRETRLCLLTPINKKWLPLPRRAGRLIPRPIP